VELVRREAQQVDRQRRDVDGHPPDGLGRIGMKPDARFAASRADRLDRLDHARLVVHPHDRNQADLVRPLGKHDAQRLQVHQPVRIVAEPQHLDAEGRQRLGKFPDRAVLQPAGHEDATVRLRAERPADRQVHRLGPAGREHQFAFLAADQRRDRRSREQDLTPRGLAGTVHARRIGPMFAKDPAHRRNDGVGRSRGGVVVQVDRGRHCPRIGPLRRNLTTKKPVPQIIRAALTRKIASGRSNIGRMF